MNEILQKLADEWVLAADDAEWQRLLGLAKYDVIVDQVMAGLLIPDAVFNEDMRCRPLISMRNDTTELHRALREYAADLEAKDEVRVDS